MFSDSSSGVAVEELVLVDGTVGAALARRAVVGGVDHDGVLELAALLQVVDDAADLHVGVLRGPGVDLHEAREQLLLVGGERVPRADVIGRHGEVVRKRVYRGELGAKRQDALGDHPRQDPLAVRFVAVVELALVLVDVFLRRVVRGMVGTRAEPHEPRLGGIAGFLVFDHPEGLIGQVLRKVIALLGRVRRFDRTVVLDQVGIPVVGFAANEAVVAVEAHAQRPALLAGAQGNISLGHVVVLAQPERAPAAVLQDLSDCGALLRNTGHVAGKSVRSFCDACTAVEVVVASSQERGARWRAQRRRVPLRVHQAVVGQLLQRRHVDPAAKRRPCGKAGVVVQHEQDVRRARRCPGRCERFPIGLRVADIKSDGAFERSLRHCLLLPCAWIC
jgi:hypothetical protein